MKECSEVWIVEDEPAFRRRLEKVINLTDEFSCTETFGSFEQMQPLLRMKRYPDLMLVDIQLPGTSGIEIIRQVRAMYPVTQFVVLTISENRKTVFEAICAGATGYLLKNSSIQEILDGMRLVLSGGSPLSGPIASMILDAYRQPAQATTESELTRKEIDILNFLASGLMKKEISSRIDLSSSAVDYHLRNIYRKLQVHSQAGAVAEAFRKGLIE